MEPGTFFSRHGPYRLSEIAEFVQGDLSDPASADRMVIDVRPLSQAGPSDIAFLDNRRYVAELKTTGAGACLLRPALADHLPETTSGILTQHPYHALARVLGLFYPEAQRPIVHEHDAPPLHPDARLEEGVAVQPGAVIGPMAEIGAGTVIAAGAVIGAGVKIGRGGYVGPNATIIHSLIGDRVIIHSGASIGQDGFGFAMGPDGHLKVPQIGRVIIQDDVEIGANTTVDRGALTDTVIGEGTKIDNLVQIGHNVQIGRGCVIAGQVGISGSVVLEDFVVMGGQSGCVGHIRIGAGAQIAGASGVSHSVPPGERWGGAPAKPVAQWSRDLALIGMLGEMLKGKALGRLKQMLTRDGA